MTARALLGLMLAVGLVFVASCTKDDPEADAAAIRDLVAEDTVHFQSGTAGDSTENPAPLDDTTVGPWWRGPQTHDPQATIEVVVEDDSAWVGWHQSNYGELIHWARTGDSISERWIKELTERVQLNAVFMREGGVAEEDRGWVLKRISLAAGHSDTVNAVRIDSIRILSSQQDFVIVDPLGAYFRLDSLVSFTPAEQLTITLYTNATDGFAFLHAFWGILLIRMPFQSEGDGVFTGTWNAQIIPGLRFAIFDLISEGTLLNPEAPYDHCGWLLPYLVQSAD